MSLDVTEIGTHLRPVIPQSLRVLQLDSEHFKYEVFGHRVVNELVSFITVTSESSKLLRDSRFASWVHDVPSQPGSSRYVGPTGLQKM